jgi:LuxR family maltose regulon positive regulatory protein
LQRDWPAAARVLGEAAAVGRQGGNLHIAVPALNALANIQALQGRLHQARATAEEALDLASGAGGHPLPIAAGAVSALAELACERNALDVALDHARQAVQLGRRWGNSDALGHAYLTLATVLTARGALDEATGVLSLAERAGRERKLSPDFAPELRAVRARLWLASGDLRQAARWAREATPSPTDGEEVMALARVHLASGRPEAASAVLAPLLEMARAQDLTTWRIAGGALDALIHQAQGEEQQALNSIAEALTLAQAERYVRRFLDLGTPLARLLRNPALHDVAPDYVQGLLAAFGLPGEMAGAPHGASLSMIEPLSPRELEVLSLVAEGMTNREIGARLYIAESTVKSHLNTVYGKLGVRNRTQAVARARSLNIL